MSKYKVEITERSEILDTAGKPHDINGVRALDGIIRKRVVEVQANTEVEARNIAILNDDKIYEQGILVDHTVIE